jgi:hypothetical protein
MPTANVGAICTNSNCNSIFYGNEAPNFCPSGGKKAIAACPDCGKKIGSFTDTYAKFCEGCGRPLKTPQ